MRIYISILWERFIFITALLQVNLFNCTEYGEIHSIINVWYYTVEFISKLIIIVMLI